jgi:hypothetical protein
MSLTNMEVNTGVDFFCFGPPPRITTWDITVTEPAYALQCSSVAIPDLLLELFNCRQASKLLWIVYKIRTSFVVMMPADNIAGIQAPDMILFESSIHEFH